MPVATWGDIPATTVLYGGEILTPGATQGTWDAISAAYKHISIMVPSPSVGGNFFYKSSEKLTIVSISSCVRAATSATFNIQIHSDPTSTGEDVLHSDAAPQTDGDTQTSFSRSNINVGDWLFVDVSAVSGTPLMLTITILCQLTE